MTPHDLIDRLLADQPKLHELSAEHAALIANYGVKVQPGPASWAVPPTVIHYLREVVKPDHLTIETGGGYTTIALAALARHHTCVTNDENSVERMKEYMQQAGIAAEKVTFMVESSDTALPKLPEGAQFDFALIDGNHAFPFPAVDWHYIDLRLKVGGELGVDNTEIRAVYDLCRFLEENQSYTLTRRFTHSSLARRYGTNFYRKTRDDGRETFHQPYNLKPAKRLSLRELIEDARVLRRKIWPWD